MGERWGLYIHGRGWMVDDCADGAWSYDVQQARWWRSQHDAMQSVERVRETGPFDYCIVLRLR